MRKNSTKWLVSILTLVIVFATGCQALGGVNVNQAMLNSFIVKSYEGNTKLSFQLDTEHEALAGEEDLEFLNLFSDITLDLTNIKQQNNQNASTKGTVSIGKEKIPFHVTVQDDLIVFDVEGAKKPFSVDLSTEKMLAEEGLADVGEVISEMQSLMQTEEFQKEILGFFINNFNNPKNLKVDRVTETINNESVSLYKISATIEMEELFSLLKSFMENIVEDEAGLKHMLEYLHDLLEPMILAHSEAEGEEPFFSTKEEAVETTHTLIVGLLKELIANFDDFSDEVIPELFPNESKVSFEFYVDDQFNPRKQVLDLLIGPMHLSVDSELWNVNKEVQIDKIVGETYDLDTAEDAATVLSENVDQDSYLYHLLKNEFKITQKQIFFFLEDGEIFAPGLDESFNPYIKGEGSTMVPLRFISEEFGAKVEWNYDLQQVTIVSADGKEIIVVIGDENAKVNGKIIKMSEAPDNNPPGVTFVPLRFIAEELGADIGWDDEFGIISITLD